MTAGPQSQPSCMNCKHYFVTFDPAAPRGCRLFGFKSHLFPSLLVKKETGEDCEAFELHPHKKASALSNHKDRPYE